MVEVVPREIEVLLREIEVMIHDRDWFCAFQASADRLTQDTIHKGWQCTNPHVCTAACREQGPVLTKARSLLAASYGIHSVSETWCCYSQDRLFSYFGSRPK